MDDGGSKVSATIDRFCRHMYLPARVYRTGIINIIIVMSMVRKRCERVLHESYICKRGYRASYANKHDQATLFYAKRVTAVTSNGRERRLRRETHRRMCARLNKKKIFRGPEEFLFSHRAVLGHLEIRRLHQQ